jgi:hypothetical protein
MMSRVRYAAFRAGLPTREQGGSSLDSSCFALALYCGLLSGLDMQSEISELLEELYYDALE